MNDIKKQKDMTLKDELKLIGAKYTWLLEKSQEIAQKKLRGYAKVETMPNCVCV